MDGRYNLYSKLFLPKSPVSVPQFNKDPKSEYVLRCKNFNNKNSNMNDDDIHNEMTDYIIETALYHKNLDKSVEAGTRLQSLRDTIKRVSKCMAHSTINGGNPAILSTGGLFTMDNNNIHTPKDDNVSNAIKELDLDNKNYSAFEQIVIKTLKVIKDNNANLYEIIKDNNLYEFSDKIDELIDENKNYINSGKNILDIALRNEYNIMTKDHNGDRLRNGDRAPPEVTNKYFNFGGENQNIDDAVCSFDYIIKQLENSNGSNIKKILYEPLLKTTENFELTIAKNTVRSYIYILKKNEDLKKFISHIPVTESQSKEYLLNNIKETFNEVSKNYDHYQKFLENSVMGTVKKIIVPLFPSQCTKTDSNDKVKNFFDNIVNKWNNLDTQSAGTYRNIMNVINDNKIVNESEYCNLKGGSNTRINLKKISPGSNVTLFEQYIPEVENAEKIFYTDSEGNIRNAELNQNKNSKNILKDIYHSVYNGKNSPKLNVKTTSGTVLNDVPNNLNNIPSKNKFDLNISKIVRDHINNKTNNVMNGGSPIDSDEFYDLSSMTKIYKDNNGELYVIKDNKKINLTKEGDLKKSDTDSDNKYCLYKSLLNDDSVGLEKCISEYDNKGFDNQSKKEIENIHPLVALRILQKFGFKQKEIYDSVAKKNLLKIETVDDWFDNFMKKQFTESQMKNILESDRNKYVINYLNKLVHHVNSNPSLLNDGHVEKSIEQTVEYLPIKTTLRKIGETDYYTFNSSNNNLRFIPQRNIDNDSNVIKNSKKIDFLTSILDIKSKKLNIIKKNIEEKKSYNFKDMFNNAYPYPIDNTPKFLKDISLFSGGNPYKIGNINNTVNDNNNISVRHLMNRTPISYYGLDVNLPNRDMINDYDNEDNEKDNIMGVIQLKKILNDVVSSLKNKGKEINKDDLENIEDNIVKIGKLEEDILKNIYTIGAYSDCLDLLDEDYKDETLSIELLYNLTKQCIEKQESQISGTSKFLKLISSLYKIDEGIFSKNISPEGKLDESSKNQEKEIKSQKGSGNNNIFTLINGNGDYNIDLTTKDAENLVKQIGSGTNEDPTMSEAQELTFVNHSLTNFIKSNNKNYNKIVVSQKTIDDINELL